MHRCWRAALWGALILSAVCASPVVGQAASPTVTVVATTPSPTGAATVIFELTFSESVTGLEPADLSTGGTATGCALSALTGTGAAYEASVTGCGDGTLTLTVAAGAVVGSSGASGPAEAVTSAAVVIDRSGAPTGSLTINGGSATTDDPALGLTLTAAGFGNNLRMRFSLDGGDSWTEWEPFAATRTLSLPPKWRWGTTTVSGQLRDAADRRLVVSDDIGYVQAERSTMQLRPSYVIRATLDYAKSRLTARQAVTVTNRAASLIGYLDFSLLARHYGELSVSAVEVDGARADVEYTNSANMRVPLGFNLRPDESARVLIVFTSTATSSTSDHLRSRFAKANGLMQISSWHPLLSNGHGLRHPGDSQFSVAADYTLELTHPSGVVIAAPGTLLASSATTKTYQLDNAREYAFAASPSFVRRQATTKSGVKVEVFNRSTTKGAADALAISVRALERHAARFGPYPYDRFVVAEGARASSGLEYSGVVFIGALNFGYKLMLAHEVAHQWWYGVIGNDQLAEPWLDEAFAEFSSRYLFGYAMPNTCSTRPVDLPVTAFSASATGCTSYAETVYRRGSVFLDGVRQRMGNAAFFDALRAIATDFRFGVVTTADVRAAFTRYAADRKSLNSYMDGFLQTPR